MRKGDVDMVIVGSDRTTANGDVCNKIGSYLKALAAKDNDVPFYVALPGPTIDWTLDDGMSAPKNAASHPKCGPAASTDFETTGRFSRRPMTAAMSRVGTPSSATPW